MSVDAAAKIFRTVPEPEQGDLRLPKMPFHFGLRETPQHLDPHRVGVGDLRCHAITADKPDVGTQRHGFLLKASNLLAAALIRPQFSNRMHESAEVFQRAEAAEIGTTARP